MDNQRKYGGWRAAVWWATLVIAVLAVPTLGASIALALGGTSKGIFGVAIFIVTCWICTLLGMKLMHRIDKNK